jgi:DNA-binding NtrC family response regulator
MTQLKQKKSLAREQIPQPRSRRFAPVRKGRLLIVDDDVHVLNASRRLLCDEWEVETAGSAEQAVVLLRVNRYNAILSDFDMPGKNGVWLLSEVKRSNPKTRRVLISGTYPHGYSSHMESGVVECFLPKPANRPTILASLIKN